MPHWYLRTVKKRPERSFKVAESLHGAIREVPLPGLDPVSTGRTWSSNWMAFASEELHTYANLRNGGGDPCRLIGYSQKYVSTQISKRLPDNRTWRLPKGRIYTVWIYTGK